MVTAYKLDGWVQFLAVQDFSLLHSIQINSVAYPTSCPMGIRGSFPRLKRQERDADHSPPCSAEVKKSGAIPSLPHMSCWYSHIVQYYLSTGTTYLFLSFVI
jgi:hypothetical protein